MQRASKSRGRVEKTGRVLEKRNTSSSPPPNIHQPVPVTTSDHPADSPPNRSANIKFTSGFGNIASVNSQPPTRAIAPHFSNFRQWGRLNLGFFSDDTGLMRKDSAEPQF